MTAHSNGEKNRVKFWTTVFFLLFVVLIAYGSTVLTKSYTTGLTKGNIWEMTLNTGDIVGTVVPKQTISFAPTVTNRSTESMMLIMKIYIPTYGNNNKAAYTFTPNTDYWTQHEEDELEGNYIVSRWGYSYFDFANKTNVPQYLGVDETSEPLTESFTMVDMSTSDFKGMQDVNIEVKAWLLHDVFEDFYSLWNEVGD